MHLKKGRAAVFIITAVSAAAIMTRMGTPFAQDAAAALFLAALVSFAATPFVRLLAYRINALDIPRDGRRMHDHPIPRIGGLAIILGFFAGTLILGFTAGQLKSALPVLRSMLPGAVVITALGLADDIYTLGPWPKLAVQTAAALAAVLGGNIVKSVSGIYSAAPCPLPEWSGMLLSVLWIVGVTNAVNLIDGLDGLACGISIISSMAAALIGGQTAGSYAAILAAALAGACIGFLPYNLNPAWIFMGDTGATFLGYTLAVLFIQGFFRYPAAVPSAVPCLILGLPVFDTCFAIARRIAHGRSPLLPDRGHIYHRLLDRGLSQRQTTILLWAVSAALSAAAAMIARAAI